MAWYLKVTISKSVNFTNQKLNILNLTDKYINRIVLTSVYIVDNYIHFSNRTIIQFIYIVDKKKSLSVYKAYTISFCKYLIVLKFKMILNNIKKFRMILINIKIQNDVD